MNFALMNLGLKQIELDKMRGYWKAKGFVEAGRAEPLRINRTDCYITFLKKNWVCKDLKGNTIDSRPMLFALLKHNI